MKFPKIWRNRAVSLSYFWCFSWLKISYYQKKAAGRLDIHRTALLTGVRYRNNSLPITWSVKRFLTQNAER
jgi:hypothetical protein